MSFSKRTRISRHITQIELFISCQNLKDLHTFGHSNPLVEVYIKHNHQEEWVKLGQTEMIEATQNPDFLTSFKMSFTFEEQVFLRFKAYDIHHSRHGQAEIHYNDYIGEIECNLGQIVGNVNKEIKRNIKNHQHDEYRGSIMIRVEEVKENNDRVFIQFESENLENVSSFFGHLTPFFYLGQYMDNGEIQRFYMSEVRTGNGTWKIVNKTIHEYCNGDLNRNILLEVYDHHRGGDHKLIGVAHFTLQGILSGLTSDLNLLNPHDKSKHSQGKFLIGNVRRAKIPSFLDYLSGGLEITVNFAIDFTSSNGDPSSPESLHYLDPRGHNHYESAIFAISEFLLNYNNSKSIPVYGFGAEIEGSLNQCFPLTFDAGNPTANGVEELLNSYRNALYQVSLSGPTYFSPIIREVVIEAERIHESQLCQRYDLLVILTDGDPNDMQDTIDWIVRGSYAPLSIVIVGIGSDYFENVEVLGADDKQPLIDSDGRQEERDIVEFIHYREVDHSPTALCQAILSKLPNEIVAFFHKRGIFPNVENNSARNKEKSESPQEAHHHHHRNHQYKVDK
ncbi:unnamed protein product [Blepharisma stoltei]|uniref:Uncharacterized protein n=1 Tax=Blepharisma stoltei TaxID=1481888 RepID=A0AAU9KPT8_9CILI|nr:unnamed protein product [Blepharisma stoltei]